MASRRRGGPDLAGEFPGLVEAASTRAAKLLAERYGGDPGSADWRHFGRLAGFTNPKPSRRRASGLQPFARLLEASGQVYRQVSVFIAEVRAVLAGEDAMLAAVIRAEWGRALWNCRVLTR